MKAGLKSAVAVTATASLIVIAGFVNVAAHAASAPALRTTITVKNQAIIAGGGHTTAITIKLFRGTKPVRGAVSVWMGLNALQANQQKADGSCGNGPGRDGPATYTTNPKGVFTFLYAASSHVGFCFISSKAGPPSSPSGWKPQSWIMIAQKDPTLAQENVHYAASLKVVKTGAKPGLRPFSISQTCTNPLAVCKTWTLTVTHAGSPVPNVTVGQICVVDSPPTPADSLAQIGCGPMALTSPTTHLAATKTNGAGQINMTYTASNTAGNYDLWVQEASTGAKSQIVELKQF
jgi:hypothetical protein